LLALAVGQAKAERRPAGCIARRTRGDRRLLRRCGRQLDGANNVPLQPADDGFAPWAAKPDLSAVSPEERSTSGRACAGRKVPGERFACERAELTRAGFTVHDEAGSGQLHAGVAGGSGRRAATVQSVPSDSLPISAW